MTVNARTAANAIMAGAYQDRGGNSKIAMLKSQASGRSIERRCMTARSFSVSSDRVSSTGLAAAVRGAVVTATNERDANLT